MFRLHTIRPHTILKQNEGFKHINYFQPMGCKSSKAAVPPIDIMNRINIFEHCRNDTEFMKELEARLTRHQYEPNTEIYKKGEIGNQMYFVSRGQIEVRDQFGISRKNVTNGDVMGEACFLCQKGQAGTAVAVEKSEVSVLEWDAFEEVASKHLQHVRKIKDTFQDYVDRQKLAGATERTLFKNLH